MPFLSRFHDPRAVAQSSLALSALIPTLAFAQATPDVGSMFANATSSIQAIINGMPWVGMIIGLALTFKSILAFRDWTENGGRTTLKTPIGLFMLGVLLVCLPGSINMFTETLDLGANTGVNLLSEGTTSSIAGVSAALTGVLLFVKLVGHIAVIRGLLILKRAAEGQQGGEMGRALTHIGGGAAAININTFLNILATTVGASLPFS